MKFLIVPGIYSKMPSETFPTDVGKPKYHSPKASISICRLLWTAFFASR
jgi:hypothetical protein